MVQIRPSAVFLLYNGWYEYFFSLTKIWNFVIKIYDFRKLAAWLRLVRYNSLYKVSTINDTSRQKCHIFSFYVIDIMKSEMRISINYEKFPLTHLQNYNNRELAKKTLLEKYKITPEYYSIIGYSLAGLFNNENALGIAAGISLILSLYILL